MGKIEFIAEARTEFLAEVAYYNKQRTGLGAKFIDAVEKAVALALVFPDAGSSFSNGVRRIVVKGFPFALIYKPLAGNIIIFAIAHQSRRPGYWRERVDVTS
nr:type II toxin-antitoxin system RelE/ParE family toxin [uncultured Undibacterium sp.]